MSQHFAESADLSEFDDESPSAQITTTPQKRYATHQAIITACKTAHCELLIPELVQAPISMQRVRSRIGDAVAMRTLTESFGFPERADSLILGQTSLEEAGHLMLRAAAARTDATPIDSTRPHEVFTAENYFENCHQGIVDALALRFGATLNAPHPAAKDFSGIDLAGLARLMVSRGGRDPGNNRVRTVQMAMTTSDFPAILTSAVGKTLISRFERLAMEHRQFCDKGTLKDFRPQQAVSVSSLPGLLLKPEGSEIKYGSLSENVESYQLSTYARGLIFSREAMINDDLDTFRTLIDGAGHAAARLERDLVFQALTKNPPLADGKPLFHADHGNLDTTGQGVGLAGLNIARRLMRSQRDANGGYIYAEPRFLIVPVGHEADAEALVSSLSYKPATGEERQNPVWVQSLIVIADPRLDAASADAWYLLSAPSVAPTIRLGFLNGQASPEVQQEDNFDRDVLKIKVRHDVACAPIGWIGAVKMA